MLADDRALQRSLEFASEWLNLSRLANMQPNADRFPEWDSRAGCKTCVKESLAFFRELVWEQGRPFEGPFQRAVHLCHPAPGGALRFACAHMVDSSR